MMCDMCGKDAELFKTIIEGTEMDVCASCSKFGKVISKIKSPEEEKREQKKQKIIAAKSAPKKEKIEVIVPDYGRIIRRKREEMNLSLEDFAKKVNEKASVISKIETGHYEPDLETARKLEKMLHIKLIEVEEIETEEIPKSRNIQKGETLTLGDMVRIKKR